LLYFNVRLVNYHALPPYSISNNSTFSPSLDRETSELFHRLVAINYYDPDSYRD
jgi:hypothetical protein